MESNRCKHMCYESDKCKSVELGFVEEPDSLESLQSYRFPSKVGGRPAWLALKHIPRAEDLACLVCGKTCSLLLQIYSPDENSTKCFHRTLFVFVCRDSNCYQSPSSDYFVVLRSQLPKENEFYSDKPPVVETASGDWKETSDLSFPKPSAADYNKLCIVCGAFGAKICSKCRMASYCSKEHQKVDWKSSHKQECKEGLQELSLRLFSSSLFPEFKLVTETEEETDDDGKYNDADDDDTSAENNNNRGLDVENTDQDLPTKELESMAMSESEESKVFQKFKHRINKDPDQVLRYHRGCDPLWVSAANVPSPDDIPACQCGAKRTFEFQVLPQLLNHLDVDSFGQSLDWGTLAVYTCSESCDIADTYVREFLWKQDFVDCQN